MRLDKIIIADYNSSTYIKNYMCIKIVTKIETFQGGIACIKKTIKKHKGQTDIELKTLWLSNTLRNLNHDIKIF